MPKGYHHKGVNGSGTRYYFNEKDKLHRTDGPAIESSNGTKQWYVNGERHRTDGPAIEYSDGTKEWHVNGEELTEQEFNKLYPSKPMILPTVKSKYRF